MFIDRVAGRQNAFIDSSVQRLGVVNMLKAIPRFAIVAGVSFGDRDHELTAINDFKPAL